MSATLRSLSRRALLVGAALAFSMPAFAEDTIKFGLVAAMSGQSAKSGEAIVRGLSLATDEINAKGGVLGKKLELVVRDDESNPAKGVVAARELVQREKVAVLFGGLDTPVSMAIVPFANQSKVPFMGVWAAGTAITRNGAADNYVFRVSAVEAPEISYRPSAKATSGDRNLTDSTVIVRLPRELCELATVPFTTSFTPLRHSPVETSWSASRVKSDSIAFASILSRASTYCRTTSRMAVSSGA